MSPESAPESVIEMTNVSWFREGRQILSNINWSVKKGEHWAVIGLNGSGKTSLLNMVNGYIFPSHGELTVLGKKFGATDLRTLRRSIGWVSTSLQEKLFENDAVEEIVLSGKFASVGLYDDISNGDRLRASNLLERFGCAEFSSRKYSTLSQGEKQKVILARAIMNSPRLLVLDEPCTGLDVLAREGFLQALQNMNGTSDETTLLYVSHHVEEVLPLFTHTLLLRRGEIHSSGKTEEVMTQPKLSDFYDRPVSIKWNGGRPYLFLDITGRDTPQLR